MRYRLQETLLDMIVRERTGQVVDRIAIKNVCQILMSLKFNNNDVYEEIFEKPFLEQSTQFYRVSVKYGIYLYMYSYIRTHVTIKIFFRWNPKNF